MNGDSQAMPIHEIDVPMLRLFSSTCAVTPVAIRICTPPAISPTNQARSPSRTIEAAYAIALIVFAVMSMISSIWAFSIDQRRRQAMASPAWRDHQAGSKALVKAAKPRLPTAARRGASSMPPTRPRLRMSMTLRQALQRMHASSQ